jgi:hypothetical protein
MFDRKFDLPIRMPSLCIRLPNLLDRIRQFASVITPTMVAVSGLKKIPSTNPNPPP